MHETPHDRIPTILPVIGNVAEPTRTRLLPDEVDQVGQETIRREDGIVVGVRHSLNISRICGGLNHNLGERPVGFVWIDFEVIEFL